MTNAELIKALRTCADHNAVGDKCYGECPYNGNYNECVDQMILDAADALEAANERIVNLLTALHLANEKLAYVDCQPYTEVDGEEMIDDWVKTLVYEELKAQMPKEGEWIHEDLDNFRKYKVTCPHCGEWYIGNYDAYDEPSDFNYCPHCGNICNPANLAWEKELSERERKEQTDADN